MLKFLPTIQCCHLNLHVDVDVAVGEEECDALYVIATTGPHQCSAASLIVACGVFSEHPLETEQPHNIDVPDLARSRSVRGDQGEL